MGNFDVTGDVAGGEAVTSIGCPLVALIVNPVEYDSQLEMRMMALVDEGAQLDLQRQFAAGSRRALH